MLLISILSMIVMLSGTTILSSKYKCLNKFNVEYSRIRKLEAESGSMWSFDALSSGIPFEAEMQLLWIGRHVRRDRLTVMLYLGEMERELRWLSVRQVGGILCGFMWLFFIAMEGSSLLSWLSYIVCVYCIGLLGYSVSRRLRFSSMWLRLVKLPCERWLQESRDEEARLRESMWGKSNVY